MHCIKIRFAIACLRRNLWRSIFPPRIDFLQRIRNTPLVSGYISCCAGSINDSMWLTVSSLCSRVSIRICKYLVWIYWVAKSLLQLFVYMLYTILFPDRSLAVLFNLILFVFRHQASKTVNMKWKMSFIHKWRVILLQSKGSCSIKWIRDNPNDRWDFGTNGLSLLLNHDSERSGMSISW